ncbi:MAG: glycosyltransferase family 9 protein [Pedosphaera sp.]|nr:glycosyltransferase family 9 protein [Pedosphaera sp.]
MKLLVISLAGIGDTLFATPLIHELRANFPGATIDALVLWRGAGDVLAGNPHLNRVHQRNLIAEPKLTALKFLLGLRRERYDASFNTHPQSRVHYRFVARIIGARTRVSHSYHGSPLLDRLLVNRLRPQDYARHAIENNLALLELFDAKPKLERHGYELFLTPAEHEWAEGFITEKKLSGRKLLGIHVGSGGTKNLALRRWPLVNYIALVNQLTRARADVSVILFGGPEEERDHAQVLAQTEPTKVFQQATKDLREAAALVKRCHAFLSVDTALMHVAAAMRVPGQVVIETPTWNKPIEPYGNPFTLVKNPAVAGRNLEFYCYDGHGIRGLDEEIKQCMESVTVDAVLGAVAAALG